MTKLLNMLGVFTLAFSIGGIAAAADNTNADQDQKSQQPQTQRAPATVEQRELEYLAAVKKCEQLATDDEKQKCFGVARNKHGQM